MQASLQALGANEESKKLEGKPEINYPTPWEYRIILLKESKDELSAMLGGLAKDKGVGLDLKMGKEMPKYISMVFVIEVASESERDGIFASISNLPYVKMVM